MHGERERESGSRKHAIVSMVIAAIINTLTITIIVTYTMLEVMNYHELVI